MCNYYMNVTIGVSDAVSYLRECGFPWSNYSSLGEELGLQDDEMDKIQDGDSGFKGAEGCLSMWLNDDRGNQNKTWQVLLEAIKK